MAKKHPLPPEIGRFWKQRFDIFLRFNEGIKLNKELWYLVTPEKLAEFIAKFIQCCLPEASVILDVCSGGAGNTIQFAKTFDRCIGVELLPANLECAETNVKVYGVEDKCEFILMEWKEDSYKQFENQNIDCVFALPPWGGVDYNKQEVFDLENLKPFGLTKLLKSFIKVLDHICLFLPKNLDLTQISQATRDVFEDSECVRVTYCLVKGHLKGILCFWGEAFRPEKQPAEQDLPTTVNLE